MALTVNDDVSRLGQKKRSVNSVDEPAIGELLSGIDRNRRLLSTTLNQ